MTQSKSILCHSFSGVAAKLIISLLVILQGQQVFSQSVEIVRLTKRSGVGLINGGLMPTKLDQESSIKNKPSAINKYILKYVDLLVEGDSVGKFPKSRIHFLVGNDTNDSLVVIVDRNRNLDFNDDTVFRYSRERTKEVPYSSVNLSVGKRPFTWYFKPIPYPTYFTYSSATEQEFYLMVEGFETVQGIATNDSIDYTFEVINRKPSPFYNFKDHLQVQISRGNASSRYNMGDLVTLWDEPYRLNRVSLLGDSLYIKKIDTGKALAEYGSTVGLLANEFRVKDINSEAVVIPERGKYTLLDFWGTWCVPCKELTPEIRTTHAKFIDNVKLVSIAYDKDIKAVRKYVTAEGMSWTNVFQGYDKNQSSILSAFKISSYPTFILIDPAGKIIYRGAGKEALSEVNEILDKSLKPGK